MVDMSRAFRKKPLWAYQKEAAESDMPRVYGFWSLLCLGVGGCVGSGIFVLNGQIIKSYAGPATFLSWLIGGFVCFMTALAYAELSARLQATGSSFAFAYHGLGEMLAVLGAWFVTLEYGMSGAAVSRSWGDKVAFWFAVNNVAGCTGVRNEDGAYNASVPVTCWVNGSSFGNVINPGAVFLSVLAIALLLRGADLGKTLVNVLVMIKITTITFCIIVGLVHFKSENFTEPFIPPHVPATATENEVVGGINGIITGATLAFFGFVGFDEVAAMSADAKRPQVDIPRALFGTIILVTCLYMLTSISLAGMVKYSAITDTEAFGSAFMSLNMEWAMQILMAGQTLIILPTVVLVSYLPQSRIQYAMSVNGMLPGLFKRVNAKGTIVEGTLLMGSVFILIAAFVPFKYLNDLISGGILLSFVMTNSSMVMVRSKDKAMIPQIILVLFLCFAAFSLIKIDNNTASLTLTIISLVGAVATVAYMLKRYSFDNYIAENFHAPLVPVTTAVAIFLNFYLFWQLSWEGIGECLGLVFIGFGSYFLYGYKHSVGYDSDFDVEVPQVENSATFTKVEPATNPEDVH